MHKTCKMATKKIVKYIEQDEFELLFQHCEKLEKSYTNKGYKKTAYRIKQYRLAILLGFEAGLRISEIVGYERKWKQKKNKETGEIEKFPDNTKIPPLRSDMIKGHQIFIEDGKGGKDRKAPKPKRLGPNAIKMLPLKIKRRALQDFTTKIGREVLNKELHFHHLRHGFGSHLAGNGRPLHEIQMLMGHTRIDTTGKYLHANPIKAIEGAMDSF